MNGTIHKIVKEKRFGFIAGDDQKDYFFHRDDIDAEWDRLYEGLDVKFDIVPSDKGRRAGRVQVVIV